MCQIIVVNRGEKLLESMNDFKDHFGFVPDGVEDYEMSECLCPWDLGKILRSYNISYKEDISMEEYFVGDLDNVPEFDYFFNAEIK